MSVTIKVRTARNRHRCEECRQAVILPGHRYQIHTIFPGHDVLPVKRPTQLKRCIACACEREYGADILADACGSFCCGDTPCALPRGHVAERHSCRCDARKAASNPGMPPLSVHPKGAAAFVCRGRPVDRDGQPVGQPCNRTLTLARSANWVPGSAAAEAQLAQIARAAGWAVSDPLPDGSRDVMCNRCRRPDPALTKLLQELTR